MTDSDTSSLPSARVIRRRWPGLVWALPVAALIVVAYLGIRAFANRGTDVTVTFPSASGVSPGDTKVLENGVEVGRVSEVRIAHDNKHVELTLHLDRRVDPALNSRTRFWMIGANPNITDLASVKAAIAGVTIGMEAGTGGTPTRRFAGLDQTPIIPFGAKGRRYFLTARTLGTITRGASIRYRGQEIGKVTDTAMARDTQFRIAIWIAAPYLSLIREGSEFWAASPLKVKLVGGGLSTQLAPASVFQGAIQFDLPDEDRDAPILPANSGFDLFDDEETAAQGSTGPEIGYALRLKGAAGDLERGAPVSLLGYTIGQVRTARLVFPAEGEPYTDAVISLYPRKLDVADTPGAPASRGATDLAVGRLLRLGYRAKLAQSPPLFGAHSIVLARDKGAGPTTLIVGRGAYPGIPVIEERSSDLDDILGKVDQIVSKINRLPIEQIGRNVQSLTANVSDITAQVKPKIGPLIDKLNATASGLDAAASAARTTLTGDGANQGEGLPDTIRQMNELARSLRAVTDYVGRHPEALLRGKAKDKAK